MKGTPEDPFTLDELQGSIIQPDLLSNIVIIVDKNHNKLDLRRRNISLNDSKDILRNVLNKL